MKLRNWLPFVVWAGAMILLGGCAAPQVQVDSSAAMLGSGTGRGKIPIRAFALESSDRDFEIKSDTRLAGDSRGVLFPKQARVFLAQDLRDYVSSRFQVDPAADTVLTFRLEQAHSYFTWHSSGWNLVPFVGVVTSVADGFQQVPVTFVVELKAEVSAQNPSPSSTLVFIRRTDPITGWSGTIEKHREVYRKEIAEIRKELFERLDAQLLTQWKNGRFVGSEGATAVSNAATLASELARLDTALADAKISKEEHAALTAAAAQKYARE